MKFSLALCTYNRASLLAKALESLAACERPPLDWELLLIDNNSGDNTAAVARSFAVRLPLRYVFEPTQGLSAARNRALRECRGEVLLFTDDDVRFDADWLLAYQHYFAANPQAGWFGGRIRPLWPHGSPPWLRDEGIALLAGLMVRYDLGSTSRRYEAADPAPFGASFALRRSAFERAGEFRTDLGVNAQTPGRGEEAEYLERLRQAGVPGHYVGSSSAWHWQDPKRFRWAYLYRYGILQEISFGFKAVLQLGKGRGDLARQCVINMGMQRGLRRR
jgi:glycosyltransferase involved in cell wall biosynthesis